MLKLCVRIWLIGLLALAARASTIASSWSGSVTATDGYHALTLNVNLTNTDTDPLQTLTFNGWPTGGTFLSSLSVGGVSWPVLNSAAQPATGTQQVNYSYTGGAFKLWFPIDWEPAATTPLQLVVYLAGLTSTTATYGPTGAVALPAAWTISSLPGPITVLPGAAALIQVRTTDNSTTYVPNYQFNADTLTADIELNKYAYAYDEFGNYRSGSTFTWSIIPQVTGLVVAGNRYSGFIRTAGNYSLTVSSGVANQSGMSHTVQPGPFVDVVLSGSYPSGMTINDPDVNTFLLVGQDAWDNEADVPTFTPGYSSPQRFSVVGQRNGPYLAMTLTPLLVGSGTFTLDFAQGTDYTSPSLTIASDNVPREVQVRRTASSTYDANYSRLLADGDTDTPTHLYAYAYDSGHNLIGAPTFAFSSDATGLSQSLNHYFGQITSANDYFVNVSATSGGQTLTVDSLRLRVNPGAFDHVVLSGSYPSGMTINDPDVNTFLLVGKDANNNNVLTLPAYTPSYSTPQRFSVTGQSSGANLAMTLTPLLVGNGTFTLDFAQGTDYTSPSLTIASDNVPREIQVRRTVSSTYDANYSRLLADGDTDTQTHLYAYAYDSGHNLIGAPIFAFSSSATGLSQSLNHYFGQVITAGDYFVNVSATSGGQTLAVDSLRLRVNPGAFHHVVLSGSYPSGMTINDPDVNTFLLVGKDANNNNVLTLPGYTPGYSTPQRFSVTGQSSGANLAMTLTPLSVGSGTFTLDFTQGTDFTSTSLTIDTDGIPREVQIRDNLSTTYEEDYSHELAVASADAPTHLYAYAYDSGHGYLEDAVFNFSSDAPQLTQVDNHYSGQITTSGNYLVDVSATGGGQSLDVSGLRLLVTPGVFDSLSLLSAWPEFQLQVNGASSPLITLQGLDAQGNRVVQLPAEVLPVGTDCDVVQVLGSRSGPYYQFLLEPLAAGFCDLSLDCDGVEFHHDNIEVISGSGYQVDSVLLSHQGQPVTEVPFFLQQAYNQPLTLAGNLLDAQGNAVLPGQSIRLEVGGSLWPSPDFTAWERVATTGAGGSFSFPNVFLTDEDGDNSLRPGNYTLSLKSADNALLWQRSGVVRGATLELADSVLVLVDDLYGRSREIALRVHNWSRQDLTVLSTRIASPVLDGDENLQIQNIVVGPGADQIIQHMVVADEVTTALDLPVYMTVSDVVEELPSRNLLSLTVDSLYRPGIREFVNSAAAQAGRRFTRGRPFNWTLTLGLSDIGIPDFYIVHAIRIPAAGVVHLISGGQAILPDENNVPVSGTGFLPADFTGSELVVQLETTRERGGEQLPYNFETSIPALLVEDPLSLQVRVQERAAAGEELRGLTMGFRKGAPQQAACRLDGSSVAPWTLGFVAGLPNAESSGLGYGGDPVDLPGDGSWTELDFSLSDPIPLLETDFGRFPLEVTPLVDPSLMLDHNGASLEAVVFDPNAFYLDVERLSLPLTQEGEIRYGSPHSSTDFRTPRSGCPLDTLWLPLKLAAATHGLTEGDSVTFSGLTLEFRKAPAQHSETWSCPDSVLFVAGNQDSLRQLPFLPGAGPARLPEWAFGPGLDCAVQATGVRYTQAGQAGGRVTLHGVCEFSLPLSLEPGAELRLLSLAPAPVGGGSLLSSDASLPAELSLSARCYDPEAATLPTLRLSPRLQNLAAGQDLELTSTPDSSSQLLQLTVPNPFLDLPGWHQLLASLTHGAEPALEIEAGSDGWMPAWLGDSLWTGAPVRVFAPRTLGLVCEVLDTLGVPVTEVLVGGTPYRVRARLAWQGDEPLAGAASTLTFNGDVFFQVTSSERPLTADSTELVWQVIALPVAGQRSQQLNRDVFLELFTPSLHFLHSPDLADFAPGALALPEGQVWDHLALLQPPAGNTLLEVVAGAVSDVEDSHLLEGAHDFQATITNHDVGGAATTLNVLLEHSLDGGNQWLPLTIAQELVLTPGQTSTLHFSPVVSWQGAPGEWQAFRVRVLWARTLGLDVPEEQITQAASWTLAVDTPRTLTLQADLHNPGQPEALPGLVDGQAAVLRVHPVWSGTAPLQNATLRVLDSAWFAQVQPAESRALGSETLEWTLTLDKQDGQFSLAELGAQLETQLVVPLQAGFSAQLQWAELAVADSAFLAHVQLESIATLTTGQSFEGVWSVQCGNLPANVPVDVAIHSSSPAQLVVSQGAQQSYSRPGGEGELRIPFTVLAGESSATPVEIHLHAEALEPYSGRLALVESSFTTQVNQEPSSRVSWDWSAALPVGCRDSSVTAGQVFSLEVRAERVGDWSHALTSDSLKVRLGAHQDERVRFALARDAAYWGSSLDLSFGELAVAGSQALRVYVWDSGENPALALDQDLTLSLLRNWSWSTLSGGQVSSGEIPTLLPQPLTHFQILPQPRYRFQILPQLNGRPAAELNDQLTTQRLPLSPAANQSLQLRLRLQHVEGTAPLLANGTQLLHNDEPLDFPFADLAELTLVLPVGGSASPQDTSLRIHDFQWASRPLDANTELEVPLSDALRMDSAFWTLELDPCPARLVAVTLEADSASGSVLQAELAFSRPVLVDGSLLPSGRAADLLQLINETGADNSLGEALLTQVQPGVVSQVDHLSLVPGSGTRLNMRDEQGTLRFPGRLVLRPDLPAGLLRDQQGGFDLLGGLQGLYPQDHPDNLLALPGDTHAPVATALWGEAALRSRRPSLQLRLVDSYPGLELDSLRVTRVHGDQEEMLPLLILANAGQVEESGQRRVLYLLESPADEANLIFQPGSTLLETGTHLLRIQAVDRSRERNGLGHPLEVAFTILAESGEAASSLLAGPNPFDPTEGDLVIQYRLEAPPTGEAPSCAVLDLGGDLVRRIDLPALQDGFATWDGLNAAGEPVANGPYLLVLKADTGAGEVRRMFKLAVLRQGGAR